MTVLEDIRRHWFLTHSQHGLFPKLEWIQRGGDVMYVGTHPITIRHVKDGNTMFIHGGEAYPCFQLQLEPNNEATLISVKRRKGCFLNDNPESRDIVRAAYKAAQKYGVRTMKLTDNSNIYCPDTVQLSSLSFLTTGQTWYESILPFVCKTHTPKAMEKYRERALTNPWRLCDELIDIDVDIDIDEPGSAARVLSAMKDARTFCDFFSKNMAEILVRSQIPSFYGSEWICHVR
jgi:hypothetical protein